MALFFGFLMVLVAGFFQGTFVLPMTMTKKWAWEHTWAAFSMFGMLIFNWILTFIFLPDIFTIYRSIPITAVSILVVFGTGWGVGAVLFGLGMDRLGMALGYPIIMGLIASLGTLIPLLIFFPDSLLTIKGLVVSAGTVLVILGIVLCSKAGALKEGQKESSPKTKGRALTVGLMIAIFAGILSCLPNVGMAFGEPVIDAARAVGVSDTLAGNAVWALFFTMGFIVNFGYCLFVMITRSSLKDFKNPEMGRNLGLGMIMALMWIGSFYLYGMSAAQLGSWGVIVGWPLFISLSIVVGNLWGIWRGEWRNAPSSARALLNKGLAVLIGAVIVVAASNLF